MLWAGFGVLLGNLITVFFLPVMFVVVYFYRISAEERILVRELGDDYVQYRRRTRKLLPFIY